MHFCREGAKKIIFAGIDIIGGVWFFIESRRQGKAVKIRRGRAAVSDRLIGPDHWVRPARERSLALQALGRPTKPDVTSQKTCLPCEAHRSAFSKPCPKRLRESAFGKPIFKFGSCPKSAD